MTVVTTHRASADIEKALPYILAYGAAVFFGLVLLSPLGMAAIWPANAILSVALLLLNRRAGLMCAAVCTLTDFSVALLLGRDFVRITWLSGLNTAESMAIAALARQLCGQNLNFSDGRRLAVFLFGAVFPVCAVGALMIEALGPAVLPAGSAVSWYVSHTLGATIVIPAAMVIANRRRYRAVARPSMEVAAAMLGLAAVTIGLFWFQHTVSLLFLIFPLTIVMAARYGPIGAAGASLLIGAVMAIVTFTGLDRVAIAAFPAEAARVQWLQFFVAVAVLTALPTGGAVASYARTRNLLARRTELAREARRRADAAAAAKSEFLANMSHEIRTPLNGVIGLADALSRTELASNQREMLKMILSSGKALTALLSDALDLARADSGALKLVDEPFDVRDAIGSAAYLFKSIALEKGLAFEVEFETPPNAAATGDALRIKQVVSNLISNAVKFTDRGQVSVRVGLKPVGDGLAELRVVVRDTGLGFDEEVKARLFRRFEQGDSSVTRRYGGSGLGLSIAQRLAQMMNGGVTCDSVPGEGSVFTFAVLLRTAADGAARSLLGAETPDVGDGRLSVLVAEDHPVNRKVIQAMLADHVDLTLATNGREALDAFHAHAFDVILMDTHMPVMDGLTAIRTIREVEAQARLARTPIVSLTADAMPQHIEASLAAGADLHLAKPITAETLFRAIEACARSAEASAYAQAI